MICASCGAENRAGRKFCLRCGDALSSTCGGCGASNEPEAIFCGECGGRLIPDTQPTAGARVGVARLFGTLRTRTGTAPPAPAPVAERRLVSVLFTDLVGFTPFAEERDAEDVRETLDRYFELAAQVIRRHGGTVEKFIGDAVMAAWGAPIAGEDDAERAVRAGLELVAAIPTLGEGMAARAGVLTGEAAVAVGPNGQAMLAGDLVNTASRLQATAHPGSVLVGEATMRAASRAIAFEAAGELPLKGKAVAVRAWRATAVVAERRGRGRPGVLEPPFVGREEELRALKEALHATTRERRSRLVSIAGTPGIGKTRLAWELEKYVDGVVEQVFWHAGRSPAHGDGVAAWALGEIVRGRAGLAEGDDEPTTRAAVERLLVEWVPGGEDRRWVEPALLTLLGLAPPPPGGRDVLFAGWRLLFERIAARGTTVLVFEDCQWADDGLLDFVEHLLAWARSSPILVISLARPELFERRPSWGAGTRAATSLVLEPLAPAEMRSLVLGLVPGLPERPLATLLERAAGIPLYAVETLRMLTVEGRLERADGAWRPTGEIADLAVPETLRSLVAARLDALDPADRSLLQEAAVLGGSFTLDGLAAVSGVPPDALEPRLRGLVRHELLALDADPRSPERGQYAFVQALVREVVYGTLARAERRALHIAAARHLETLGTDEVAGALAAHCLEAHRDTPAGPAADALATLARGTLGGAARRALDMGAHDQAVAYVEQALPLPGSAGEGAALLEIAARAAGRAGHLAAGVEYATRALALREGEGDPVAVARGLQLVEAQLQGAGRVREAVALLEEARASRSDVAGDEADAILLAALARARYNAGAAPEQVLSAAELALTAAERLGVDDLVPDALVSKAGAYRVQGRHREAASLFHGAIGLARTQGDVDAEGRALNNLALLLESEDLSRCVATHRECVDLWRRLGRLSDVSFQTGNLAYAQIRAAVSWDEPLGLVEELMGPDIEAADRIQLEFPALEILAARGELGDERFAAHEQVVLGIADPQQAAILELTRARVEWCRGNFAAVSRAGLVAFEYPGLAIEGLLESLRGAVWLRDGPATRRILALLEANADSSRFARAARSAARGGVAGLEGRVDEAGREFREAARLFGAGSFGLPGALCALDHVFIVGPGLPDAQAAADAARAVFDRVRATVYLERLGAVLAGRAVPVARSDGAGGGGPTPTAATDTLGSTGRADCSAPGRGQSSPEVSQEAGLPER